MNRYPILTSLLRDAIRALSSARGFFREEKNWEFPPEAEALEREASALTPEERPIFATGYPEAEYLAILPRVRNVDSFLSDVVTIGARSKGFVTLPE